MVEGQRQPVPDRENSDKYLNVAASQLASILALPDTPFVIPPLPGTMRGIDVYRAQSLVRVVACAIGMYVRSHRRLPNLVRPASMNEKLLWSKFFTPMPMPSAGDKLATASYLPPDHRGRIASPDRVWTSTEPLLPANDEVPPGVYFQKANHGCGFNLEIRYPLSEEARATAQTTASTWLTEDYGLSWGEWWYAVFERRLLLEAHLGVMESDVPDWKFWVLNGRVHLAVVCQERATNHRLGFYGRNFECLPLKHPSLPQAEPVPKPAAYDAMLVAAEAIGQRFSFARVDFYLPPSGQATLGEITLCPNNALTPFSRADFDCQLGEHWDPRVIGPRS